MRILFIASRLPYPPLQGDRARAYHFLRLLKQKHRIVLVTPTSETVEATARQAMAVLCECWIPVRIPRWQAILHLCSFPFSSLPLQTLYFCPPVLQKRVQALLCAHSFDLVHVQLARMAPVISKSGSVPRVLDFIDALSLNMQRRSVQEPWPARCLLHLEAERMARYEQDLVASFDQQVVSSPVDREVIGAQKSLHVIPNGVDVESFPYTQDGRDDNVIIFTGRMSYFPNVDAALYFAVEVFPLIVRRVPDTRLLIVGADPAGPIRKLACTPGIEVTGYVSRIQDYLTRATIAVAPMRTGSGMQFKVLEAMASGTPVVASPFALGGVEARDGEHLLVGHGAQEFADKVVFLLGNHNLRRTVAYNARQLVERRYTWEASVTALERVYEELVVRHRRHLLNSSTQ